MDINIKKMFKASTTEYFISKAIAIHGKDKFRYDRVEYKNYKTEVEIFCNRCQKYFMQRPSHHYTASGCTNCKGQIISEKNRLTTSDFIAKAISVHGSDRYDYKEVVYTGSHDYVWITCNVCGNRFSQQASKHSYGNGCSMCARTTQSNAIRKTKNEFINDAVRVHGNLYGYDSVIYIGTDKKVDIYCKKCNKIFRQLPQHHLQGRGCPKCGREKRDLSCRSSPEKFISMCISIHGDKFDYKEINYQGMTVPVKIYCKACGLFFYQTPAIHLHAKWGCQRCAIGQKDVLTGTKAFVTRAKQVHGDKYDYECSNYTRVIDKIQIYCKACSKFFEQVAASHLQGRGCKICGRKKRPPPKDTSVYIEQAKRVHGDKLYNYDLVQYKNCIIPITIYCNRCKEVFIKSPSSHLYGKQGCPRHKNKTQYMVLDYVRTLYPDSYSEFRFECLKNRKFDIYIPSVNLIIEIDGDQHFRQVNNWKTPEAVHRSDVEKMTFAISRGISIIRFYQPDIWNNKLDWKDIIGSFDTSITSILCCSTKDVYNGFTNDVNMAIFLGEDDLPIEKI